MGDKSADVKLEFVLSQTAHKRQLLRNPPDGPRDPASPRGPIDGCLLLYKPGAGR